MKNGDGEARTSLIEHNLRLVSHIIKKYYANYDEQEDLVSIGTIGLIKAIDSFDCDKGVALQPMLHGVWRMLYSHYGAHW